MKPYKSKTKIEQIVADLLGVLENPEAARDFHLPNQKARLNEKTEQRSSNDGLLTLRYGRLELIPPKPGGNWPVIDAGERVLIKVNGKRIVSPTIVKNIAEVEIEILHEPPHSSFNVELSQDEMEVILQTIFIHGKTFDLINMEPQNRLKVLVELTESTRPEPIEEKLVYLKLKELGVVDINTEAIRKACNNCISSKTIVAEGTPAIPPVNGWVQYLFDKDERLCKAIGEEESIDFFDKGEVNSVEAGQVLAVLHPPIFGKPGLTVKGNIVFPPEPKTMEIQVGKGVKISDDGQAAIATLNGRPTRTGRDNVISVISQLVISGNVDIDTGHIRFKGDVIVLGNVTEGLVVEAGGQVQIYGSVHQAKIYGEAGVSVKKGLIGGIVCAGGEAARYRRILPKLEKIAKSLEAVVKAFGQVKNNPRFSTDDLKVKGEGALIKLILEMRFPQMEKILHEIKQLCLDEENDQGVAKVIDLMNLKFIGLGPLAIKSINEVENFQVFIERVIETIRISVDIPANVTVGYCQNSQVEATGDVLILKEGMYHSKIFAGGQISIRSICRGGELYAQKKVTAKELGSETGAQTLVGVDEQGKIKAECIFPGVLLRFGTTLMKNQDMLKKVEMHFQNGFIKNSY
ncbi:MAG: FapA family protein [Bacillota bacterium]|nr:FapA family protein [Bacillota bacterium]